MITSAWKQPLAPDTYIFASVLFPVLTKKWKLLISHYLLQEPLEVSPRYKNWNLWKITTVDSLHADLNMVLTSTSTSCILKSPSVNTSLNLLMHKFKQR